MAVYYIYSCDCEVIIEVTTLVTTFWPVPPLAPNFTIRMCVFPIVLIYIYVSRGIEIVVVEDTGYDRGRELVVCGLDFEKGVDPPLSFYSRSMVSFGPRFASFPVERIYIYRGTKFPIERIQEEGAPRASSRFTTC